MENNKIVAKVNEVEITEKQVEEFIALLGDNVRAQLDNEEGRKKVADELVAQELLYLEAKENHFDEEESFIQELQKSKKNLLTQFAFSKMFESIQVTDSDLQEYYESHKEFFKKPAQMNADHILVEDEEKANQIVEEINNGLDFGEAASKYSSCPSKENGGNLGTFSTGQMVPEFEQACLELEQGSLSKPVKTQFGYHIIRLNHRQKDTVQSFNEVKEQLYRQFLALKQQEVYMNKVKELKEKSSVETFY